jgi:hypothetical protein
VLLRRWFSGYHPADPNHQLTLRRIRRNRQRVPKWNELSPLFRKYAPPWSDEDLLDAWLLITAGPKGRISISKLDIDKVLTRSAGRPPRFGIRDDIVRTAKKAMTLMIASARKDLVCELTAEELRAFAACGLILTEEPSRWTAVLALQGEARSPDNRPLWFELPWQQELFWRGVGLDPPGLSQMLGILDRRRNPDRPLDRADRAARDILQRVFSQSVGTPRPQRAAPKRDEAKAMARAETYRRAFEKQSRGVPLTEKEFDELTSEIGR